MIDHIMYLSIFLAYFATQSFVLLAQSVNPTSHLTILGVVYCDTCYENSFSNHSYFLSGAEVHVQCKFNSNSPKTTEEIAFSVNRTTNRYGIYKLDIPAIEGVDCVENKGIQSFCETTLIKSTTPKCNTPSMKTTVNKITVKSKQDSLCIYSLSALTFKPPKKNITLCGKQKTNVLNTKPNSKLNTKNALNSSKFFFSYYFPPYVFPWPQLPPFPKIPFPPCPPFPFPFPPSPPGFNWGDPKTWIPNIPFFYFPPPPPPPPPVFNWGDPKTWIPNIPFLSPSPPPQPVFNWGDPRSWIPNIPLLSPPPPSPTFDLRNPRTWIPYIPPIPPTIPENKQP